MLARRAVGNKQHSAAFVSGVILLFSVAFTSQVSSPPGRLDQGGSCNGPRAGISHSDMLAGTFIRSPGVCLHVNLSIL
jgi:hypothetical protein